MLEDMQLRNFSAGTQQCALNSCASSYIHYVTGYATYFNLSPAKLGLDDIRNYQLHLIDQRQLSPNSINGFLSAVQFLYTVNAGYAVVQAAVRTHESSGKAARRTERGRSAGLLRPYRHLEAPCHSDALLRLWLAHRRSRFPQSREHRLQAHADPR